MKRRKSVLVRFGMQCRRTGSRSVANDPIQTLAAKIAVLQNADIIQCRCASLRRHNLDILPKLPSVTALSDDIALREGGV
jgi:hypothetical protein